MTRVAIVTGGVVGIGAATCRVLKQAGYKVAATFVHDVASARPFREETGIPTFQWNEADFAACELGVAEIAARLGPVDILVNNAGITRDATLVSDDAAYITGQTLCINGGQYLQ